MQKAAVVLEVLRERGGRGLPCDELYRQMFNKDLYLLAYGRIYSNKGAMTPGADSGTADGMSEAEIYRITGLMRREKYRFAPARRVYIPKKNGKLRPLGMPTWTDKLVGEVVRLLLEAYYEPQFSGHSHAYRERRGCHTALREIERTFTGTTWFIESDISGCFDNIDHEVILAILAEKIHDNRFLRLIRNMLKAGYLEDWEYHDTLSGTPQGGVVSPVLSNIYLHKLDEFIEREIIPQHTRGKTRQPSLEYGRLVYRRRLAQQCGDRAEARDLRKRMRAIPSKDPVDPNYRRLRHVRYADDVLLGFVGPKAEAEQIKAELGRFLRETLKLEMNPAKTLITHARTRRARFLGYDITVQHSNTKITRNKRSPCGTRAANGKIALLVPPEVIRAKCAPYRKHGKPWHRSRLQNLDDYDIVRIYGAEYRGIVNYYLLARNVSRLSDLRWNAGTSMLKTLAAKHRSTVTKMAARHKAKIETSDGLRTCFEARKERKGKKDLVARFAGIPLRRDRRAVLTDPAPVQAGPPHKELIHRLRRQQCELCEHGTTVAVHQVASLASLGKPGPEQPAWAALMARMRRKTLIVCARCHEHIHANPAASTA
jgi:group II intron reverse transcriptase/maturase